MKSGTEVKEDAKGGDEGGSSDSDSDGVEDLMGLLDDVPSSSSSAAATTEKKGKKTEVDVETDPDGKKTEVDVETDPDAIKAYKDKLKEIIHDKMFVDDVGTMSVWGTKAGRGDTIRQIRRSVHEEGFTFNMWKSYVEGLHGCYATTTRDAPPGLVLPLPLFTLCLGSSRH